MIGAINVSLKLVFFIKTRQKFALQLAPRNTDAGLNIMPLYQPKSFRPVFMKFNGYSSKDFNLKKNTENTHTQWNPPLPSLYAKISTVGREVTKNDRVMHKQHLEYKYGVAEPNQL